MLADADPQSLTQKSTYREAIVRQLRRHPDQIIIHHRHGPITADRFLDKIGLMVDWLQPQLRLGLMTQQHRPIGLMFHDNVWSIAAMIACWHLRVPPLLLDHRLTPKDLDSWIARCDLSLIVTQQARLSGIPNVAIIANPDSLQGDPLRVARGRALLDELTGIPADPLDIAEYMTSSGVSGPAKLYPIPQKDILINALASGTDGLRGAWGSALSAISVVFGGARLVWWRNLLFGVPIHSFPLLFSSAELDRELRRNEVEECTLPPYLIRALVEIARRTRGPVPRYPNLLKLQCIGGPALPEDKLDAQRLLTPHYLMTYSSTETGVMASIDGQELRDRPASCGRPLRPDALEIVDGDENILPTNAVGRIRVTWPALDDAPSHQQPSRVYPGDHGWLDNEGYLYLASRGDGIICRNGVNFSSAMLEKKIMSCPNILDAAVIRVPRPEGDDDFLIAVIGRPNTTQSQIDLSLRNILSAHEQPAMILMVDKCDITPGGKIARSSLIDRFGDKLVP